MFTGIIEEIGYISSLKTKENFFSITIKAQKILSNIAIGDSIAVNGVCLTVAAYDAVSFTADIMKITLERTMFSDLHIGSLVNLERALQFNGKIGGHFVSGHIDAIGTLYSINQSNEQYIVTAKVPSDFIKLLIPRGSVTVNGISLTITEIFQETFSVSIIPHTFLNTTFNFMKNGCKLHCEADIFGKYIYRILNDMFPGKNIPNDFYNQGTAQNKQNSSVTEAFLEEHGFK